VAAEPRTVDQPIGPVGWLALLVLVVIVVGAARGIYRGWRATMRDRRLAGGSARRSRASGDGELHSAIRQ